jgi:hypothetical protein
MKSGFNVNLCFCVAVGKSMVQDLLLWIGRSWRRCGIVFGALVFSLGRNPSEEAAYLSMLFSDLGLCYPPLTSFYFFWYYLYPMPRKDIISRKKFKEIVANDKYDHITMTKIREEFNADIRREDAYRIALIASTRRWFRFFEHKMGKDAKAEDICIEAQIAAEWKYILKCLNDLSGLVKDRKSFNLKKFTFISKILRKAKAEIDAFVKDPKN